MIEIKLRPEYQCWPLWSTDIFFNGAYNIDPDSLPISEKLKKKINDWREIYDATLNIDYPPDSRFADKKAFDFFKEIGREIRNNLQSELGSNYQIDYDFDKYEYEDWL